METNIIKIGNSKGLRLSRTILEKYDIKDKVEIILKDDHIIIRALSNPRSNWDVQFKKMHEAGDDQLLINDIFVEEQIEEWK